MEEFDVAILGAGISGIAAAMRASELDAKVCLIEGAEVGGRCIHKGLYPYRFVMDQLGRKRRPERLPNPVVESDVEPGGDFAELLGRVETLSKSIAKMRQSQLESRGVRIINAPGILVGSREVQIQNSQKEETVTGKSIIIATGSTVSAAATIPFDGEKIIAVDDVFQMRQIPESVLILGGGRVGCEWATLFNSLGSKTFLCDDHPRLLREQDPHVTETVENELKRQKIKILLNKKIISIFKDGNKIDIALDGGVKFSVNVIVVTTPRKARIQNLNTGPLGIRLGEQSQVLVDETMETTVKGVFAVGSVTGRQSDDCLSEEEGRVAAENALGKKARLNADWVPRIIYTRPEIATVGCFARDAHHQGFRAVEGKVDISEIDHCLIHGETQGFFKVVADRTTRKVIGGQIVAAGASEAISLILLAIRKGLTINALARLSCGGSTRFQGIREAAKACVKAFNS